MKNLLVKVDLTELANQLSPTDLIDIYKEKLKQTPIDKTEYLAQWLIELLIQYYETSGVRITEDGLIKTRKTTLELISKLSTAWYLQDEHNTQQTNN